MFKSNILFLSVIRYFGIILSSVVSLMIAKFLAPKDYADWSMYLLILQYFTILTLGLEHGVTQIVSLKSKNRKLADMILIISIGILFTIFLFFLFLSFLLNFERIEFLRDYNLYDKIFMILLASTLFNVMNIGTNFLRAIGQLRIIVISVTIFPIIVLFFLCISEVNFLRLLGIQILSFGLILLFYGFKIGAINFSKNRLKRLTHILINKSLKLLLFNISISITLWSSKFLLGIFETKLFFGSLSLAFSVNQAALLLVINLTYLNYPKLLRLANSNSVNNYENLVCLNELYFQICIIFSALSFVVYPLINMFFPEYFLFQKALHITNAIQALLVVPTLVYLIAAGRDFHKRIVRVTLYFVICFVSLVYLFFLTGVNIPVWSTFIICYILYIIICYKVSFDRSETLNMFRARISLNAVKFVLTILVMFLTAQFSYSLVFLTVILLFTILSLFINFRRYERAIVYLSSNI
jgi:O-antigen/teichoic acid export membrane protein